MKITICLMLLAVFGTGTSAFARGQGGVVSVRGYLTRSGNYVAPHVRSAPDHSKLNNWSTVGNVNPYTGKIGYKNVWKYGIK